jgi:hypothetical protein
VRPPLLVELRYGIPLDWTHTSPKHNKREPSHLWTALVVSSTMPLWCARNAAENVDFGSLGGRVPTANLDKKFGQLRLEPNAACWPNFQANFQANF